MSKPVSSSAIIDQKDIKKTISLVLKNWYWFVLFLGLGIGGSIFYLYKATKYYGATAEILIKPQKNAFKDALSASLSTGPSKDEIANEIEVLSSSRLINDVIGKLNIDISYFIEGRIKTGEIYKGKPFLVDGKVLDATFYGAPFFVNILDKQKYKLTLEFGAYKYSKIHKFGEPVVNDKFSLIINSDSTIVGKNSVNLAETRYLFRINDRGYLVKKYKQTLQLSMGEEATVIEAFIEDEVPEKAVDFLKVLTEMYLENSVSVQKEINENTLAFIDGQLKEVEDILNGVESNLEQFQRSRNAVNPEGEQGVYLQQKVDFETQRAQLGIRLRSLDYLYEQLTSGTDGGAISPALLGDAPDPAMGSAFTELSALQQRKTNLLFSNTPSSPVVKEVEAQLSIARQNLISIVMNMRRNVTVQINSLSTQLGQFQGAMNQMPSTIRGLVNINRKVEINEKIYLFLLETRAQTVIEKAGIVADKSILEPAITTGLERPIQQKILLGGVAVGLVLSFLLIFLKSIFYNFIHTKEDLTELTTLPIIGVIGKSKDAKTDYLVVDKFPQSLTSEAYRVVRTNLSYFSPKASSKVVLFTSSVASEGKTFNAINTGTILAKTKKKVVLVDLDLHKPKQANAFNLMNDVGVTSYLVGKSRLSEIIKETPIENLQVILTGPRTPNASELILDPMLEEMINELKTMYDYVILDTPPVGLLSDALALMKFSDLNVYVLKAGFSKKDFVDIAHQIVEKNNVKHLVFLLNNVNVKNIPAGYGGGYYK
ncbi:MAG: polysaccharide biosynthesis tyrosine autokinase [Bacteroidia bacterium]|nr:polysaccharide biosynthesis tyrosine autokinase [Bacteroidota bacterium]MBK7971584.1 polysaccharide biosynthesis tyrosine autokinase [Bacteroidota bacterium]MBK8872942.1 polysaccharide biosynthesis tyrosine autokinase [Bacteroidota bacterium]MBK9422964.1 polysaccharide biosynthesis tyrosine autokinase [Bacteroidota bacterium]MBP9081492.1 polysaccharide biosynthesis tyrosine autokinase [Bacteroidia bacterium]